MTDSTWHIARNNKKVGPFSTEQLKKCVASGELRPPDMLLLRGAQKWIPAGSVEGLFPPPASTAPPQVLRSVPVEDVPLVEDLPMALPIPKVLPVKVEVLPREEDSPLTPCSACERSIAKEATICPNCGHFALIPTRICGWYRDPTQTVRYGEHSATYTVLPSERIEGSIPLSNYRQGDGHSCGFLAALTVLDYLIPNTTAETVLRAMCPIDDGIDKDRLIVALEKLGVRATYFSMLTVKELRRCIGRMVPVILTVCPGEGYCDHWTVVRGFGVDCIYLTNNGDRPSLPINRFEKEWYEPGEALLCRRI